jgi:hypothetical protein
VNRIVLDAPALLAILHQEPGAEIFAQRFDLLENASMSAVNVAEAYGKLVGLGIDAKDAWEAVISPSPRLWTSTGNRRELRAGCCPKRAPWDYRWETAHAWLSEWPAKRQSTQRIGVGKICG